MIIQRIRERSHPPISSPAISMSPVSIDTFDGSGYFEKYFLKFPRVSFSFHPLYKPIVMKQKKITPINVVTIILFKYNERWLSNPVK